ncbi:MAG: hypothetical protein KJ077_07640 [Anaerolineae bacterium]|nr:hypothetical protein [Anaerolineae bacterium]
MSCVTKGRECGLKFEKKTGVPAPAIGSPSVKWEKEYTLGAKSYCPQCGEAKSNLRCSSCGFGDGAVEDPDRKIVVDIAARAKRLEPAIKSLQDRFRPDTPATKIAHLLTSKGIEIEDKAFAQKFQQAVADAAGQGGTIKTALDKSVENYSEDLYKELNPALFRVRAKWKAFTSAAFK